MPITVPDLSTLHGGLFLEKERPNLFGCAVPHWLHEHALLSQPTNLTKAAMSSPNSSMFIF
jgi:hypothetical protein